MEQATENEPRAYRWMRIAGFVLAVLWAHSAIQNVLVYNKLQRTIPEPDRMQALHIVPEPPRTLRQEAGLRAAVYEIGSASFASAPGYRLFSRVPPDGGTVVLANSTTVSFAFLPPVADGEAENAAVLRKLDKLSEQILPDWLMNLVSPASETETGPRASVIDVKTAMLGAAPLPLWRLLGMTRGEGLAYFLQIASKSLAIEPELERILPFEAPNTFGLIYVQSRGTRGKIELANHERTISQTVLFRAPDASRYPSEEIAAMLASYRFTIAAPVSHEELAARVAAAGIAVATTPEDGWQ